MGMTELIAANTDDYIRLTVKLGTDEAFNQQMSRKILAENQVLFTHSPAVHELEVFLLNACNAPR
jgi:predicted O-linked N-acetylglucosamine transferase (SPINDLY family)